jgi:hypothetical protein
MVVFDIPLHPPDNLWRVACPDGESCTFSSRHQAVACAAKLAARLRNAHGEAYLSLEGEDGRWRLFTPELKAPMTH